MYDNGDQMMTNNLIMISVDTKVIDEIGRRSMKTEGAGDAMILRNGDMIEARWVKDCSSCRMRFLDTNQEEVVLILGVTWIEVVPDLSTVQYINFQ